MKGLVVYNLFHNLNFCKLTFLVTQEVTREAKGFATGETKG